jgi:Fe-S-cluster-containing hydrogenase component 2
MNACKEIQNIGALVFVNTEYGHRISFNPDKCVSCGECVQVCPVGGMLYKKSPLRWRSWETTRALPVPIAASPHDQLMPWLSDSQTSSADPSQLATSVSDIEGKADCTPDINYL